MHRIFGLDLLRSSAISFVLISHLIFALSANPGLAKGHIWWATLGVDQFFVLSGFLIGEILLARFSSETSFPQAFQFWIRRWFRTLPNYYLFLGLNILIYLRAHGEMPPFAKHVLFVQNLFPGQMVSFFDSAWSLAVEEWFYLLLPLSILGFYRFTHRFQKALLLTLAVFFLTSLAYRATVAWFWHFAWDSGFRKITLFRLDALALGVFAAYSKSIRPEVWKRFQTPGVFLGVLTIALTSSLFFSLSLNHSYFAQCGLPGLFPLGVFFLLPALDQWQVGPFAWGIGKLSRWSYSLYLVHPIVFSWLFGAVGRMGDKTVAFRIGFTALAVCLSLGVSALLYVFFERPTTDLREKLRFFDTQGPRWAYAK